jgi:hypothetical protein
MRGDSLLFVDGQLRLYDRLFYPRSDIPSPILAPFPSPVESPTYEVYAQRANEWRKAVKKATKYVLVPVPILLTVHVPRPPDVGNPPLIRGAPPPNPPLVALFTIHNVFSPAPAIRFSEIVYRSRSSDAVPLSAYLSDVPKWQSQLIPREPSPYMYQSYDEYATALRNWAAISHEFPLINHPSEFEEEFELFNEDKFRTSLSESSLVDEPSTSSMSLSSPSALSLPPPDVFDRLFAGCSGPAHIRPVKHATTLPFASTGSPHAIASHFQTFTGIPSRDLALGLIHTRPYGHPSFSEVSRAKPDLETLLLQNLPPDAVANEISKVARLSHPSVRLLHNQFSFLLPQLERISDSRLWCKMFIVFTRLLSESPTNVFSLIFSTPTNTVNMLKMLSLFAQHTDCVFRFFPVDDRAVSNVQFWLLKFHLSTALISLSATKPYLPELKSICRSISQAVCSALGALGANFDELAARSLTEDTLIPVVSSILQMAIEFRSSTLVSMFGRRNLKNFYMWLGSISSFRHREFGLVCCAILRGPTAQEFILANYLKMLNTPLTSPRLLALSHLAPFIAFLLNIALETQIPVEARALKAVVCQCCQMLNLNPEPVVDLVSAICRFYARMLLEGQSDFLTNFFDFRGSLLYVFNRPLGRSWGSKVLHSIEFLFSVPVARSDPSENFTREFLMHLLAQMVNKEEEIALSAWRICRSWMYLEPNIADTIFRHMYLKTAFMALLTVAPTSMLISVQLLLLFYGYTTHPETRELTKVVPKRKRLKMQEKMIELFREQRLDIAAIHEMVIAPGRKQSTPAAVAEIKMLEHVWHKRGTIRKSG